MVLSVSPTVTYVCRVRENLRRKRDEQSSWTHTHLYMCTCTLQARSTIHKPVHIRVYVCMYIIPVVLNLHSTPSLHYMYM